jgi:hypothetical protein
MCILAVQIDHAVEVLNGLFVVVNHLVRLCTLVKILDLVRVAVDAPGERPD